MYSKNKVAYRNEVLQLINNKFTKYSNRHRQDENCEKTVSTSEENTRNYLDTRMLFLLIPLIQDSQQEIEEKSRTR